jgi:membrane protein implicated in regulation of membrane protease activity
LGRVLAADYALALLMEALAAYICGVLMDHVGLSAYQVSFVLAVLTSILTAFWYWYHRTGYGAGNYRQATDVSQKQDNRDDLLSTERNPLQSETENST